MKKFILFVVACLFIGTTVSFAQPHMGGRQNMGISKQVLKDSLKLTDAKADSVAAIMKDFQSQQRSIMMDQSLSQEDKAAKRKDLNDAQNTQLSKLLSPAQMEKLKAIRKEQMEKMMELRKQRMDNQSGGGQ